MRARERERQHADSAESLLRLTVCIQCAQCVYSGCSTLKYNLASITALLCVGLNFEFRFGLKSSTMYIKCNNKIECYTRTTAVECFILFFNEYSSRIYIYVHTYV